LGAVAFAGPWFVVHLVSPSSIGFGDVKFAAALGIYLSWFDPIAGLLACALTLLAAWPHSVVHALRRTGATVPLGPYLLIGAAAAAIVA
ncbi:MAG: prepilin peptidase, partial [Ilumatobacter sp.]